MFGNAPQSVFSNAPRSIFSNAPQSVVSNAPQSIFSNAPQNMFGNAPQNVSHCGCFFHAPEGRRYIPLIQVEAYSLILSTASRTTLTQTFVNPLPHTTLQELRYEFPLYDGVSVVSFTCDVAGRLIRGVVKERQEAQQTYDTAVSQGQAAGLLDQSENAADVFSMRIGNIPPNAEVKVEIVLLGELRHDTEVDGLRFTLPTCIADRYGNSDLQGSNVGMNGGLSVTVDAQLPLGSSIKSIQSPTHPISVQIGTCSADVPGEESSFQKASASFLINLTEMKRDFVLLITGTNIKNPSAVLETHPTIPNQCAIMTTLVPQFRLPAEKPEVVFMCDRSGSMAGGQQIPNLIRALHIFLTSLPVGAKFNICSFGIGHSFLWPKSQTYNQTTLDEARQHIQGFQANYGGTEMYAPIEKAFQQRYKDINLELFVLTDGEIWNQGKLFEMIEEHVASSNGAIRVFSLGIGKAVSHSLVEGIARAGNGFSQTVGDDEKMDKKVVKMLKNALLPHITDYTLHIKYAQSTNPANVGHREDDSFEIVEKMSSIDLTRADGQGHLQEKPTISLFDTSFQDDDVTEDDYTADNRYSHLPNLSPPKYIQAPFQIPPLYPSVRTNVYVLLPEPLPHQMPKSVVFRATSTHGPLEVEIPITVLPKKSEMIHQLAARKAVQELEEGRGWIFHAKDSVSGDLLRDKYEGQFPDMVEREAVRLGVNCQVAGKWCSFVAVDDQDKSVVGSEVPKYSWPQNMAVSSPAAIPIGQRATGFCSSNSSGGFSSFGAAPAPIPTQPTGFPRQTSTIFGQNTSTHSLLPVAANTNPFSQPCAPSGDSLFGAPSGGSLFGAPSSNFGGQQNNRSSTGWTDPPLKDTSGPSLFSRQTGNSTANNPFALKASGPNGATLATPLFSLPQTSTQPPATPAKSEDALHTIITLQTFSGTWQWTADLERVMGVRRQDAETVTHAAGLDCSHRSYILATVCTILFLRHKLPGDKGAWSMMAGKAQSALCRELRSPTVVGQWLNALEDLFKVPKLNDEGEIK